MSDGNPPPGRYAQGGRAPLVWVNLCAWCAGFRPTPDLDQAGPAGRCQGCGCWVPEMHRFPAILKTDEDCGCESGHPRVTGDLPASAGRHAWALTPPRTESNWDGYARVYVPGGKMAHLLPPADSPNCGYPRALCSRTPALFDSWRGTGSQAEHDKVTSLPLCSRCDRAAAEAAKPVPAEAAP